MFRSVITGTGAYIPEITRTNEYFINNTFYGEDGLPIAGTSGMIIEKFKKITGIRERRYVPDHLNASDIAAKAAVQALTDRGIDPETLDQIIVAHNFGDVASGNPQSQNVPSLASRVKHTLGIRRPECIGYDILFGCPGWVQSLIQSEAYFRAGMAKKVLLIGTETLSRVIDPTDRDSMIFADGAGACVLEYLPGDEEGPGILGYSVQTYSAEEVAQINMGPSYGVARQKGELYMKMKGRQVYEFALKHVPSAIRQCLDSCGMHVSQVSKIFIHQANEKMDEEIIKRLYALYELAAPLEDVMPMNIQWLGNSSVATVPTLYHMVRKGEIPGHQLHNGDIVVFTSVGAGMNINAVCYRV
ncbi:MAG: ketoacyl-ACP synthase III [Agriterribacter sp.]